MLLTGHGGEIYTAKFHPRGNLLASAGFERQIFLWNVYGECDNINVMSGHTGAIVQLHSTPAVTRSTRRALTRPWGCLTA